MTDTPPNQRTTRQRLADAVLHRGPGYDLTPEPTPSRQAASLVRTEATELDKSRRYLRPVSVTTVSGEPDGIHWSVYVWLPRFEAWATGLALCGASANQGALPADTVVTCEGCEAYRPKYERYLAPGYRAEDDDPEALRQRAKRLEERLRLLTDEKVAYVTGPTTELLCEEIRRLNAEVAAARKYAAEMRDFCSPHGVSVHYADQLEAAMDRAKEGKA